MERPRPPSVSGASPVLGPVWVYPPSVASDDDTSTVQLGGAVAIVKTDVPQRNVFGWASVVAKADGSPVVDLQDDVIEPEELEKAAYDFILKWRDSGDMHDGGPTTGRVIESMVFTLEKQQALGIPAGTMPVGWWLGVHVDDPATFEKVRSGERAAFSIEGQAVREPIEVE